MEITTSMSNVQITRLIPLLLLPLAIFSSHSHSKECLASTDAIKVMSTHPELQSEKLMADTGKYSAVLKNGDIVLATFATCDLSKSAHYFSAKTLTTEERMQLVKTFLARMLPSEAVVNKVVPQLENLQGSNFEQPVVLDGMGDQHQIVIKPSASPLYKLDLQYSWIPPEF